ncbi:MAG: guanylate kinase [Pseudomonadota bacterium]
MKKGHLFVISAPSGTGKSTVLSCVRKQLIDFDFSVSYTTRKSRDDERDGKHYHFVDCDEFKDLIKKGGFVEWAQVHGNLYGTPRGPIEDAISSGRNMLLDIDVQGGMAIKRAFPDAVTIFLLPPSIQELGARLSGRGTDSPEQIKLRLENARREIKFKDKYDHCIVNDDIERASTELADLIKEILSRKS